MRKISSKLKDIKYLKKIVTFCISFIALYTGAQLYLSYKLGVELSPTLTTSVYGFFGTELAITAIIRIFDTLNLGKKKSNKNENSESDILG